MINFIIVALGGAAGAAARYSISLIPVKTAFPFLTLFTNLAGALIIGFITGISGKTDLKWTLFWKTGVCGGFTTFSTFSLEAVTLLENGEFIHGGAYILLSISLCLCGVVAGRFLGYRLTGKKA